jgi:hypothetical protein
MECQRDFEKCSYANLGWNHKFIYIYLLVLEGKRTGMGIINLSFHLKLNDGHLGRLGATLKKYVWWLMFSFHQFVISPDPNSAI